jgi:hypothetical protein
MNLTPFMMGLWPPRRGLPTLLPLLLGLLAGRPATAQTSSAARIGSAAPTNTRPVRLDFSSFKLITDRNIFSPTRTPSRPMRYEAPRTQTASYARSDYFSLVGTMEYAKGPFAFFDGTSSQYRKSLRLGDTNTIAGYRVTDITQSHVKLAQATNTIELKVGMLMRHDGQGNWVASLPTDTSVGSSRYVSTAAAPPSFGSRGPLPGSPPSPGGIPNTEPQVIAIEGGPAIVLTPDGELQIVTTNAEPAAAAAPDAAPDAGGESEVLRRLRLRREQEMNR